MDGQNSTVLASLLGQEAAIFYFAGNGIGEFSLNKVYQSVADLEKEMEVDVWKLIWKINAP